MKWMIQKYVYWSRTHFSQKTINWNYLEESFVHAEIVNGFTKAVSP